MTPMVLILVFIASVPIFYLLTKSRKKHQRLPPGSLGIPFIGQCLGLLHAMWANKGEEWLAQRIDKYGPISKLTLFGAPTVFMTGPAANKLVFTHAGVVPQQRKSIPRIIERRNMLELVGDDQGRVRVAVSQFLRPEVLKQYVGHIDGEVRYHLEKNWIGHSKVQVLPLIKNLTFDITCSLLFGIQRGPIRDDLAKDFVSMMDGMWAVCERGGPDPREEPLPHVKRPLLPFRE